MLAVVVLRQFARPLRGESQLVAHRSPTVFYHGPQQRISGNTNDGILMPDAARLVANAIVCTVATMVGSGDFLSGKDFRDTMG
ncbi:MAG: hypothetical protein WDZ51_09210 [Pirellulaceae bacterium]